MSMKRRRKEKKRKTARGLLSQLSSSKTKKKEKMGLHGRDSSVIHHSGGVQHLIPSAEVDGNKHTTTKKNKQTDKKKQWVAALNDPKDRRPDGKQPNRLGMQQQGGLRGTGHGTERRQDRRTDSAVLVQPLDLQLEGLARLLNLAVHLLFLGPGSSLLALPVALVELLLG